MSRPARSLRTLIAGLLAWLARYVGWLLLSALLAFGAGTLLMLVKDWTLKTLVTSMLVWPLLALGALLAAPVALFPVGRVYLLSAAGWALVYTLVLSLA
jgi:hypothetical protein